MLNNFVHTYVRTYTCKVLLPLFPKSTLIAVGAYFGHSFRRFTKIISASFAKDYSWGLSFFHLSNDERFFRKKFSDEECDKAERTENFSVKRGGWEYEKAQNLRGYDYMPDG